MQTIKSLKAFWLSMLAFGISFGTSTAFATVAEQMIYEFGFVPVCLNKNTFYSLIRVKLLLWERY